MNFYRAVFTEKKLFSKYLQKRRVLGYLPFNIYPWVRAMTKKLLFKILTIYATKLWTFKEI